MFSWLKRKPCPAPELTPTPVPGPACAANPGKRTRVSIALKDGEKSRTERIDLVDLLADALRGGGYSVAAEGPVLRLDCGLAVRPGIVEIEFRDQGNFQTCTTIEFSHPSSIPVAVFEFQHSAGASIQEAVTQGFNDWMTADLQTVLDALRAKPEKCNTAEMTFGATGPGPARRRRVVFGPAGQLALRAIKGNAEAHPFCPCCLFNQSIDAFKPLVEDDQFFGLRLFASRGADGSPGADCRVNGIDFAPGKKALLDYVKTWPDQGVEFRKQYVILQNFPSTAPETSPPPQG